MELPRRSIKEPIPAIFHAWERLTEAADAHLGGNRARAEELFRAANLVEVWRWVYPASGPSPRILRLNVRDLEPDSDTKPVANSERDPQRDATRQVKAAVLARDGYRCRYCGIPVIDANNRKIACSLYPDAVPWVERDERAQHAAFKCFWLQYDHVVPHSHGGSSSEDNIVITCCLCNFGKDKYTLKQLGISDPRVRPPEPVRWDGLERLRTFAPLQPANREAPPATPPEPSGQVAAAAPPPTTPNTYFLPGAWVSKGYLYTRPINGKERWFKLGPTVMAEPTTRNSVAGCLLSCDASELRRRGITLDPVLDPKQS